jgi:hypothetical protein
MLEVARRISDPEETVFKFLISSLAAYAQNNFGVQHRQEKKKHFPCVYLLIQMICGVSIKWKLCQNCHGYYIYMSFLEVKLIRDN